LFILGTLAENPGVQVRPQPIQSQHQTISRFTLGLAGSLTNFAGDPNSSAELFPPATVTHQEVIRLSPEKQPASTTEMSQQSRVAAALMKAGITNPAAWAAAGISNPAAAASGSNYSGSAAGAATATQPVSEQFDLQPKVVLMKGENDTTFLISWRSQRELVSSLGWKATACIWGGPALTLLGVYVLLLKMGLL
jgi:hypothetical protein